MMLACDNKDCPVKWFHMSCVGLEVPLKGSWICPKCEFACYKALINNRLVTGMFKHCTFRCKSNATIYIHWKFVPSFCIYNIFIDINLIFRYDLTAMRRW